MDEKLRILLCENNKKLSSKPNNKPKSLRLLK